MTKEKAPHRLTYPRFLLQLARDTIEGGPKFYLWMAALTALALVGANAWAHQIAEGMQTTGLTDHVSWGLYIANFTFGVGLAAGAVMMVIPAYLYDDHEMHDVVLLGEVLAIAAIIVCTLFILVDMGRPDRLWHIVPGLGKMNWPRSMLTWDVIVLNGYLALNLHIAGYLLYTRFLGKKPDKRWYQPFVFLSIGWAISIHTVTAFLYCGLGGRPFWNSALLAPRFIASAFISGPAFVILMLQAVARFTSFPIGEGPFRTLTSVLRITVLLNLFMFVSEVFTSLYTGGLHGSAMQYLLFGHHGKHALVPWIWTAVVLNIGSAILLHLPVSRRGKVWLDVACVMAFFGVWIEKGMGLIIPGFVPSTLHELVEYVPTVAEWKVSVGIWAVGAMVLTVALKATLRVMTGQIADRSAEPAPDDADDNTSTQGDDDTAHA